MALPLALLVDDNLMFTMNIEATLRRLGYAVRTLPSPASAGAVVVEARPALLLLSLASPAALELIRELRAQPELGGLQILAYTGHVHTAALRAARDAGADHAVANSTVLAHLERVVGPATAAD
jgi:CheY-like chemotaxis protein